jgi:hypothetical protein
VAQIHLGFHLVRGAVVKNKLNTFRFIAAAIIAPSVPIGLLAFVYANQTGSDSWYPILFLFGYLFFILIGLPVLGIVIHSRKPSTCAIAGGAVAIAPILLLSIFSIFSSNQIGNSNMALSLAALFLAGCLGGIVFWLIAFAEKSTHRKAGASAA